MNIVFMVAPSCEKLRKSTSARAKGGKDAKSGGNVKGGGKSLVLRRMLNKRHGSGVGGSGHPMDPKTAERKLAFRQAILSRPIIIE